MVHLFLILFLAFSAFQKNFVSSETIKQIKNNSSFGRTYLQLFDVNLNSYCSDLEEKDFDFEKCHTGNHEVKNYSKNTLILCFERVTELAPIRILLPNCLDLPPPTII